MGSLHPHVVIIYDYTDAAIGRRHHVAGISTSWNWPILSVLVLARLFDHSNVRPEMRTFLIVALLFVVSAALAQPTSPSAASQSDLLSMDQKVKVGAIITEKMQPLTRACLQLGGLCMRTDQNQTRNIVLFAAPPVRWGFPNQLSSD